MSEGNPEDLTPITFRPKLGAIHRPAPAGTPLIRAALPAIQPPQECRWDRMLDLAGDDGQPDALGNDEVGNCVPVAALRLMQLWAGDGRKPTREQAMALLRAWGGTPEAGTYTDEAFGLWGARGYQWSDQRQIVPRWALVEADGLAPRLDHLKQAVHALGGVLAVFNMPASAMNTDPWVANQGASQGAHCVPIVGYDLTAFYALSWGHVIPVGYAFLTSRLLQASAFVSNAWVRPDGAGGTRTPSGLSGDDLRAVLAAVEGV